MAERGPRHDGERHQADGACSPGVGRRADHRRLRRQRRNAGQQEAQGDEAVGDVQDEHQPIPARTIARPACEANRLQQGREQRDHAGDGGLRQRHPQRERRDGEGDGGNVEAAERFGQAARIGAHQGVAREAGHDAAADQDDETDHGCKAEP